MERTLSPTAADIIDRAKAVLSATRRATRKDAYQQFAARHANSAKRFATINEHHAMSELRNAEYAAQFVR